MLVRAYCVPRAYFPSALANHCTGTSLVAAETFKLSNFQTFKSGDADPEFIFLWKLWRREMLAGLEWFVGGWFAYGRHGFERAQKRFTPIP